MNKSQVDLWARELLTLQSELYTHQKKLDDDVVNLLKCLMYYPHLLCEEVCKFSNRV